jgi:hypothetical protein
MSTTDATAPAQGHTGIGTSELRQLLHALQAVRDGDFTAELPGDWTGLGGKIADTVNSIIATNRVMAGELERIGEVVGRRGQTRQRVRGQNRAGAWGEMEESVNTLIDDLQGRAARSPAARRSPPPGCTAARPAGPAAPAVARRPARRPQAPRRASERTSRRRPRRRADRADARADARRRGGYGGSSAAA